MSTMPPMTSETLKAYQDKINAQIQQGKATLEQLEAKAKEKGAQSELTAINALKNTRDNIQRKLQDLKTTHENDFTRAQTAVEADLASFKARIDELSTKLKTAPPSK